MTTTCRLIPAANRQTFEPTTLDESRFYNNLKSYFGCWCEPPPPFCSTWQLFCLSTQINTSGAGVINPLICSGDRLGGGSDIGRSFAPQAGRDHLSVWPFRAGRRTLRYSSTSYQALFNRNRACLFLLPLSYWPHVGAQCFLMGTSAKASIDSERVRSAAFQSITDV